METQSRSKNTFGPRYCINLTIDAPFGYGSILARNLYMKVFTFTIFSVQRAVVNLKLNCFINSFRRLLDSRIES